MISLKSEQRTQSDAQGRRYCAQILDEMVEMAKPGITTGELDRYAESRCKDRVLAGFQGLSWVSCYSLHFGQR